MYLKRCGQTRSKQDGVYWELVESCRTERGPHQRVVSCLGNVGKAKRLGVQQAAKCEVGSWQSRLFDEEGEPEWVEIDTKQVQAHILVCFLAYVLWKTLGQMCKRAGLGNEPRKVLNEIAQIKAVDVVMPTKQGAVIRNRCIAQPTKAQAILLQTLRLHLPQRMKIETM
jgi:hypothetical protein